MDILVSQLGGHPLRGGKCDFPAGAFVGRLSERACTSASRENGGTVGSSRFVVRAHLAGVHVCRQYGGVAPGMADEIWGSAGSSFSVGGSVLQDMVRDHLAGERDSRLQYWSRLPRGTWCLCFGPVIWWVLIQAKMQFGRFHFLLLFKTCLDFETSG